MPEQFLTKDTAFTFDRRGIRGAVLVSLFIHCVILYWLSTQLPTPGPRPQLMSWPVLNVSLERDSAAPGNLPNEDQVDAAPTQESPEPQSAGEIPSLPAPLDSVKPRMLITEETIREAIAGDGTLLKEEGEYSDNGAIVMDSDLLLRLNQAQRRHGIVREAKTRVLGTSFSGGSWADFVRVGDKCFRVDLPDPLDSLSRESWYRIKCSSKF